MARLNPRRFTPEQKKTLGEAIRRARVSRGLTQAELADEVGVYANQPSRWEHGAAAPDIHTIEHMAHAASMGTAEFIPWASQKDLEDTFRDGGGGSSLPVPMQPAGAAGEVTLEKALDSLMVSSRLSRVISDSLSEAVRILRELLPPEK